MISRHAWLSLLTLAALLVVPFAVAPHASQAQTADVTFTVDRLDDLAPPLTGDYCTSASNDCTLRQAIIKANAASAAQTKLINFSVAGTFSITNAAGLLPPIGSNIIIQGRTVLGVPQIQLNGETSTYRSVGLRVTGNNSTISSLSIYGFNDAFSGTGGGTAIIISGDGNRIFNNFIGVRPDGTGPSTNQNNQRGIRINPGADNNLIGYDSTIPGGLANVISGNQGIGVEIIDASNNKVTGNYIGLFPSGLSATVIGNGSFGIQVLSESGLAQSNRIGGSFDELEANIIGGNTQAGIRIDGSGVISTTVAGNFIGAYIDAINLGNSGDGIQVINGVKGTTLGGSSSVPLLVSDNDGYGILIRDAGTDDTTINGRALIGLNYNEDASLGNGRDGVFIGNGAARTTISGNNVRIVGNNDVGVRISDLGTNGTQVNGALIGIVPNPQTGGNPVLQLSNSDGGVLITDGPQNTTLTGNTISGNQLFGVRLSQVANTTLQSNFIGLNLARNGTMLNAGPGIDVQNSTNTLIGGTTGDDLNVISGNAGPGIRISGSATFSTTVDGNYIGVALNTTSNQYTVDAGNTGAGVLVENGPRRTTIGGFGNRIAGNNGAGVQISATLPNTVTLVSMLDNTIGFAPNGNEPPFQLPNNYGIAIEGNGISAVDVLSNTIRFNTVDGVRVLGAGDVEIQYNDAISNNGGSGVYVANGAEQVQIRDNTIRANVYPIYLEDSATERVTMIDNRIAENTNPVTLFGTTVFDGTPPDTATPGPNHDIDPPFGIRVSRTGLISGFVYTGTLTFNNGDPLISPTSACITCTVAVYQSDPTLPSPDGQPWTRLSLEINDDLIPGPNGVFSGQLASAVPIGGQLLFAATDGFGNTSAFAAFTVTPGLQLVPIDPPDASDEAAPTGTVTYSLRLENTGTLDFPNVSLFTSGTLAGWESTITPAQTTIPADGERLVTVTLTLPFGTDPNAAAGIVDTTLVTADVTGLVSTTQQLQTTVLEQAVLRVQPVNGQGSAQPGQRVTYAHRLTNDGNITVTVGLDYFTQDPANSPIWNNNTTISTDTFSLAPGQFRDVAVNVTVPETGQVGTQATTYITATVEGYPDQTRYFSDTTTVSLDVQAEMFPDETQSGPAGGEVIFFHTVRNLSNGPATYRLNSQTNYNSTVTFESDTPGVTINPAGNTFTLDNVFDPPLRTNTMRLKVTVQLDPQLLPGDQEVINIFLSDAATDNSIGGAAVVDRVNITRGQVQPRLWLPMIFN